MRAPSTSSQGAHKRWPRRNSTLSRLSMDWALLSLGSLVFVCCLTPFWGPTSPSSRSSTTLFFFKFELAFSPTSVGIWGGGGGRLIGTWVLGASFEVYPLFLLANWPFRPVLCFRSMPSSSSSELTGDLGNNQVQSMSSQKPIGLGFRVRKLHWLLRHSFLLIEMEFVYLFWKR